MPAPLSPPPSRSALHRARSEWLSGDPTAWARYVSCLHRLETHRAATHRPRSEARPRRPRARA